MWLRNGKIFVKTNYGGISCNFTTISDLKTCAKIHILIVTNIVEADLTNNKNKKNKTKWKKLKTIMMQSTKDVNNTPIFTSSYNANENSDQLGKVAAADSK